MCVRAQSALRAKAYAVLASPRDTRFDVELLVAWRPELEGVARQVNAFQQVFVGRSEPKGLGLLRRLAKT